MCVSFVEAKHRKDFERASQTVPARAAPTDLPGQPSSKVWLYHSHTNEVADTYAGLIGPIVVTKKGMAKPDGSPADVDAEVFTLFMINDENARYAHPTVIALRSAARLPCACVLTQRQA